MFVVFPTLNGLISEMAIGKGDETGHWVARYSCGRSNAPLNFHFEDTADLDISFL